MKRTLLLLVALATLLPLSAKVLPYGEMARRFAASERARFPEAWMIDFCSAPFFGYSQGVGCCAMLEIWKTTGDEDYFRYVEKLADTLVNEQGEIHRYERKTYNLDFINSGKYLFDCYAVTGKSRGFARSGALGLPGAGHVVQSGVLCVGYSSARILRNSLMGYAPIMLISLSWNTRK